MAVFSTLRKFGDNFGNKDVARQVSFFLNQRDKIAMNTSARSVHEALGDFLPTSTRYITTVKPNLMSAFSVENGVYSSPISTFHISKYGNFGNFHQSLITHVGANEDRNYYAAWYECQLSLARGSARNRRDQIDLYISDMSSRDEAFLVERLRESVDTRLGDHNCLQYSKDIMYAIASNTSIVDVLAYSQVTSCRCGLFSSLSVRSTAITKLNLVGGLCVDSTQMIANCCVEGLKDLSISTDDPASEVHGYSVDVICGAVADVGVLEVLEIGNVAADYDEWADGLIRALGSCPIVSLRINDTEFDKDCLAGMVRVLHLLGAADVKITCCDFDDWGKPVFDALFSNTSISWLDISFTIIGDGSIGALVEMIKRGKLTRLGIGGCGVGGRGIKSLIQATTHADSKLDFISIFDNDIDHPSVFEDMGGTSLKNIHIGELSDADALAKLVVVKSRSGQTCDIDARDSDDCFNEGGGVWPWVTKSHVWYTSHNEYLGM